MSAESRLLARCVPQLPVTWPGAPSFEAQAPDADARTVLTRMCWKKRPRMPEAWSREVKGTAPEQYV